MLPPMKPPVMRFGILCKGAYIIGHEGQLYRFLRQNYGSILHIDDRVFSVLDDVKHDPTVVHVVKQAITSNHQYIALLKLKLLHSGIFRCFDVPRATLVREVEGVLLLLGPH